MDSSPFSVSGSAPQKPSRFLSPSFKKGAVKDNQAEEQFKIELKEEEFESPEKDRRKTQNSQNVSFFYI